MLQSFDPNQTTQSITPTPGDSVDSLASVFLRFCPLTKEHAGNKHGEMTKKKRLHFQSNIESPAKNGVGVQLITWNPSCLMASLETTSMGPCKPAAPSLPECSGESVQKQQPYLRTYTSCQTIQTIKALMCIPVYSCTWARISLDICTYYYCRYCK